MRGGEIQNFNNKKMRTIVLCFIAVLAITFISCESDDPTERFSDFDYTTVYFPYQYPVRTLVLGDYSVDNSNDNNLKFLISARVAGMYRNDKNWNVSYTLDPS